MATLFMSACVLKYVGGVVKMSACVLKRFGECLGKGTTSVVPLGQNSIGFSRWG